MYKAIIVDDEAVVRRGLRAAIDWNACGFELLGDYTNGREAWEAVAELKPDLILSDISMPIMDGLELAASVAAHYPYMKMVILTGYDEFEYAQQAIRLKVSDFILKPVTASEMKDLLLKIRSEMDEEAARHEDISRLQSLLRQSFPLLKERFLERLAAAGLSREELKERLAYFELPELSPPYLITAIDIDDFNHDEWARSELDEEMLRLAAIDLAEESVKHTAALLFRSREEKMVLILSGPCEEHALYEEAFRIAEDIRHRIERYLKFTVTAGIGQVCLSSEYLPSSYKSALAALDYRFMFGKNRIISIRDIEGKKRTTLPIDWDDDRKLAAAVKAGSLQDVHALIEQLVAGLKSAMLPIEACFLYTQKVVLALLGAIQELGTADKEISLDQAGLMMKVYQLHTLDEIESWMKETAGSVIQLIADNRNHYITMQIARAVQYIEEHYTLEKLSLQDICRYVHMSTSYFSLVFKKQTGVTFIEYLTRTRIVKAKELLQHSSLKLYEIAGKVGYADPNYFSILFKKHAGVTPREFRDSCAQELKP
ncbi:response regulator [Paenibacillus protaetiae]|uniref:Response regulator n=1 Tax=Paenibacillus protaetiae TaxID=2509456 RepID=A0A4P6ERK0_9BACL|nr:response regulator [Paenibacillus protaetiae]QAY65065.1 response regulator [Paenibacillus protaetiae]